MKKQRITILYAVTAIVFLILALRLFQITMVDGKYYKEFSESKRIKQINTYAARGNILDRNGNVLAGNKPVYNLILYKDRLDRIERDKKNSVLSGIVNIFEKEGISYLEDYFFGIYEFKYRNNEDYFNNKLTPKEKIVQTILKNDLVGSLVDSSIEIGSKEKIEYFPVNRIIDYLQLRGKNFPIAVVESKPVKLEFLKNKDYERLLNEGAITEDTSARDYLMNEIKSDESVVSNLMSHPLSRKIAYDLIKGKALESNIELTDLVYVSDLKYIEQKAYLNRLSSKINLESKPKDDFINLILENSFDKFLQSYSKEDENIIIPAENLLNRLAKVKKDLDLTFELDPNEKNVKITYKEKDVQNEQRELPIDKLIRLAKENDLAVPLILDKDLIFLAEESLFAEGIYPKIYKSTWEYSYVKDRKDLLEYHDMKEDTSARDLFNKLKKEYLLENYDDYDVFGVISIYNKIEKQGYLAYTPVELAKNISQKALGIIEEKVPKDYGFETQVQPSRYYPNGKLASHILGYIGKLSEDYELEEYLEHKKYDYNDTVGKTGLEESFEDTLRGSKGKKTVYTNVMGQTTDILEEVPSVPGNNLYTTIDLNLQRETEKILYDLIYAAKTGQPYNSFTGDYIDISADKVESGSATIIDAKTGEILAMASYPSFDPNLFVNGISETDWKRLSKDSENDIYQPRPLMNIATQAALPPGSTFKTVTGLSALNKGMSPHQTITCMGYMDVGDQRFSCLSYTLGGGTYGTLDLYDALKVSCNYYFYSLALGNNPKVPGELDFRVTLEDLVDMTSRLRLDRPTGIEINVPFESTGYTPSLFGKQNIVRSNLRAFLIDKLKKYDLKGKSSQDLNKDINTVVSWIDNPEEANRTFVIKELEKMGYKAEDPLDGEYTGLADIIKYSYINQAIWTESDSINAVIGQGQNAYTPIQMGQLASIIANEGVLHKPTLVKEIKNHDNTKTIFKQEVQAEKIDVDSEHFRDIKEGMRRASSKVAGRSTIPTTMGSKTGTAESGSIDPNTGHFYEDFTWELGFSPDHDPEIVTVINFIQGRYSYQASYANTDLVYAYNKYVKKDPEFKNERESYLKQ